MKHEYAAVKQNIVHVRLLRAVNVNNLVFQTVVWVLFENYKTK